MPDITDISLETVRNEAIKQGLSPAEVSSAISLWSDAMRARGKKELATKDAFYLQDQVDDAVNQQKGELQSVAFADFFSKRVPELLPDKADQDTFKIAAKNGMPDEIALGTHFPANYVPAFKEMEKILKDPNFLPVIKLNDQPIKSSTGQTLANFTTRMNSTGDSEIELRLPGEETKTGGKAGESKAFTVPRITEEDYHNAVREAQIDANKKADVVRTHYNAGLSDDPVGGALEKVFGMTQKAPLEAIAERDLAEKRLETLKENPAAGRAMLLAERAQEIIKKDPVAEKIGKASGWGWVEDFSRSVTNSVLDIGGAAAGVVGWDGGVNGIRKAQNAVNAALEGNTGIEFRGNAVPNFFRNAVINGAGSITAAMPTMALARVEAISSGVARVAGLTMGVGAQTYGNTIISQYNDADAMDAQGLHSLAKTLRENARTAALSNAVIEMAMESTFGEDKLIGGGFKGSFLKRASRNVLKYGVENAIEEVAAQALQGGLVAPVLQGQDHGSLGEIAYAGLLGATIGLPFGLAQTFEPSKELQFAQARVNGLKAQQQQAAAQIDALGKALQANPDAADDIDEFIKERQDVVAGLQARVKFWQSNILHLNGKVAEQEGQTPDQVRAAVGAQAVQMNTPDTPTEEIERQVDEALKPRPARDLAAERQDAAERKQKRDDLERKFVADNGLPPLPEDNSPQAQQYRANLAAHEQQMEDLRRPTPAPVETPQAAVTPTPAPARFGVDNVADKNYYLQKFNLTETQTVPEDLAAQARGMQRFGDIEVVFARGNPEQGGAHVEGSKVIVINLDNPQAPKKLLWHEFKHRFEHDPDFRGVFSMVKRNEKFAGYAEKLRKLGYNEDEIDSEFEADLFGEQAAKRSFWRRIQQRTDPTVFQRIHDGVLDTLEGILRTVLESTVKRTGRGNASKTVENLKQVRAAMISTLNQRADIDFTEGERALNQAAAPRVRQSRSTAGYTEALQNIRAVPQEEETGATLNIDGTTYNDGGLVVPLVSQNFDDRFAIGPEDIEQFLENNEALVIAAGPTAKVGLYKFPNSNQVSVDLNVVAPREARARALDIARNLGQESLFDLDTFENVKTGADGQNTVKLDAAAVSAIADELTTVAAGVAKSNNEIIDKSPKIESAQEVRNFVRDKVSPLFTKLRVNLTPNYTGYTARYVWSGPQGRYYVEYNPNQLVGETENSLLAAFREELIHAAEGEVLRKRGDDTDAAYIAHYTAVHDAMTPNQRKLVKSIYRSTKNNYDVGAEFSRMVIQRALYGNITEQFRASKTALQKISELFQLAKEWLGKVLSGKAANGDVIKKATEAIQKIDKAARQGAAIRESRSAPARWFGGNLAFSTRVPSGRNAVEQDNVIKADMAALNEDETFKEKMSNMLRQYPQVQNNRLRNPDKIIRELIDVSKGNLRFLWDLMPVEFRDRAGRWYEGAHALAQDISVETGLTVQQVAGAMAVLSPQKDWFQNVSVAERTITIVQDAEKTNRVFSEEMRDALVEFTIEANIRDNDLSEDEERVMREEVAQMANVLQGRRFNEMSTMDKAVFVRAADFIDHSRNYMTLSPEGDKLDVAKTKKGKFQKAAWGSYGEIAKAVSIIQDGSPSNIHERLGNAHKVRNFFNNISDPQAAEDFVTIDTHAVAAALLEALSGTSPQVEALFSSAKKSKATGLQGPYAIYAQAYTELAAELTNELGRRVPARELQSVTWEAIRMLFTKEQKKSNLPATVRTLWEQYNKQQITLDGLRTSIATTAGGIGRPAWSPSQQELAFDQGVLPESDVFPGVPGVSARRGDSGRSAGRNSGGTSEHVDGLVSVDKVRSSRSRSLRRRHRFNSQKTKDQFDAVESQRLVSVANKFVPSAKLKAGDYKSALDLLNNLRDRDSGLARQISTAVNKEFGDRLDELDDRDKETESKVLRAQVIQVILGNVIALARRLQIAKTSSAKVREDNNKKAAKLYNAAKETAYSSILQVSGDRYSAARILQSAQISAQGQVSEIMFNMMDGLNRYLFKKTGITQAEVEEVDKVKRTARKAAATDAILETTPQGKELLTLRQNVKAKIRKVASWLGITSESKSGLTIEQERQIGTIKTLLARMEFDYRANVETLLARLEEALEFLEGPEQAQALTDLVAAVKADEELAHKEFEVLGDSLRKLDAAVDRFVADPNPTYRFGSNPESQILAKIRLDVRQNKITPEQGGDVFVRAKGDPTKRAALVERLEEDRESQEHLAVLEEEAAKAEAMVNEPETDPAAEEAAEPEDPSEQVKALAERLLEREVTGRKVRPPATGLAEARGLLARYARNDTEVTKEIVLEAFAKVGITGTNVEQALDIAEGARLLRAETQQEAADAALLEKQDSATASAARAQRASQARAAFTEADRQQKAVEVAEDLAMKALGATPVPREKTARQEAAQVRQRFVAGKPETEDSVRQAYRKAGIEDETIDKIIPLLQVAREAKQAARQAQLERDDFEKRREDARKAKRTAREKAEKKSNSLVEEGQRLIDQALGNRTSRSQTKVGEAKSLRSQYVNSKNAVTKAHVKAAFINAGYADDGNLDKMLDAAEAARMLRNDDRQAKAAARFKKKLDDRAEREKNRIAGLAKNAFKPKANPTRRTSVEEDMLNTINDNPDWDISNPADKLAIIEEVLIRRGLSPAEAKSQAGQVVARFNDKLGRVMEKVAKRIASKLTRGKLTENDIRQAVRLNLLNPSSSLATTLAASKGWKGLTDTQLGELSDVLDTAEDIHDPQVRLSLLLKQQRIILRATGLDPETHDLISSSVRASAYSGAGSLLINATVPVLMGGFVIPLREFATQVLRNPLKAPEVTRSTIRAMVHAARNALASSRIAFKYDATLGLSAAKDSAGPESVGVLAIDALTRRMDMAIDRINDKSISKIKKGWEFIMLAISAQRILWKTLGALDSAGIAVIQEFLTEMKINQDLRKGGVNPAEEFDAFMDTVGKGARYGVDALGLTPLQAHKEMLTRAREAYYQFLTNRKRGVNGFEIHGEARREALSIMGNHEEVQGTVSLVGNKLADWIGSPKLLGLGSLLTGPVRIISQVIDMGVWMMPGYNIIRYIREKNAQSHGEGRFGLHAGSAWQLQRRLHEVIAGNVIGLLLYALLAGQDPDDPWFEITGAYPTDPGERALWQQRGLKEYTMYFGHRNGKRLQNQFTRGAFEFLTMPAIAAKQANDVINRGKPVVSGLVQGITDFGNVGVPAIGNMARSWDTARKGNADDLYKELAWRGASLLPFSGAQRSLAKLSDQPSKDDTQYLWSQFIPATVLFNKGEMHYRNALNESPLDTPSVWNTLARLGLPLSFVDPTPPKDTLLAKDFSKMNYNMPPVTAYKQYVSEIDPQATPARYNEFVAKRAEAFKRIYREDPAVGENARDQRGISEILLSGDKQAYKDRMGGIWSRATRDAKEQMGLVRDR